MSGVPATDRVLDRAGLLEQLGGDLAILHEVIALYQEERRRLLEAIRAAVARGDADALRRAAHTLKGTLGSLMAHDASTAAEALERLARAGDLTSAATGLLDLETKLQRLDAELLQWLPHRSMP